LYENQKYKGKLKKRGEIEQEGGRLNRKVEIGGCNRKLTVGGRQNEKMSN